MVTICNNHISGRVLGALATNLVLKVMSGNYNDKNYVTNYQGISVTGKVVKSSPYFIRDNTHKIIGMLCINIDIDIFMQLQKYLDGILKPPEDILEKTTEHLSTSTKELAQDSICTIIDETGISPERMSLEEKRAVVHKLHENGIFLVKGSFSKVATILKVSNATIYRYLSKIKKDLL